jgi:arsenical pump membrane protein
LTAVLADAVALACLAVLLATAILHLPWRREAAVAVAATVVVLATGLMDLEAFEDTVRELLGLNIGSGLTWTGSLANLLWRRTLVQAGRPVSSWAFHRVSAVITPVCLTTAVLVLWATS